MSHLEIRGLTVRYGATTALDRLDLAVERGEIFVLLGGSGSGKTTLLRALGGFVAPVGGAVLLDGRDVTRLPPHLRPVNTTFQSYALFPHLSVAANIGFGLRRQGVARAEAASRVAELLDLVRLPGYGPRRVTELSGGQQQRVALARSLAPRPALLLLDEPLSALDRRLREDTRGEIVALLKRLGTTAILVTHDQEEALATGDRIGVLQAGRLAQVGPPRAVYERPASRFVAEFLGAANLLPATVRAAGPDGAVADIPGGTAFAPGAGYPPGTRLTLILRPERLRLVPAGQADPGPPWTCLRATLEASAFRGAGVELTASLSDGTRLRALVPPADPVPPPGSAVRLAWPAEAGILLSG